MKTFLISFIFSILLSLSTYSQSITYVTSGGEMIFSFANIEDHGKSESSILRWAPLFNAQSMANLDLSRNIGFFTGIAVRNVGYIYGTYTDPSDGNIYKKKFRSYNVAFPLGIKLGNLNGKFIYGGYEVEFPFLYKEKTFNTGGKINTITGWFSRREELVQHGFLVGIEFPYGFNLKFKYYMSGFHNQNYVDAAGNKPYDGLKANIFYISLSSYLFKNFHFETMKPHNDQL